MPIPFLLAWMEQRRDFTADGIDPGQIRAFVEIAIDAGEAEVLQIVPAAVLSGDDVLDMEGGQRGVLLMEFAVFATGLRALANEVPQTLVHAALPDLNFRASRRRTATNLLAFT